MNKIEFSLAAFRTKDGMTAVVVRCRQAGSSADFDTGVRVFPDEWDGRKGMVVRSPNARKLNLLIRRTWHRLEEYELDYDGDLTLERLRMSWEELLGMESKMFTQALLYRGIANFDDFNKAGFGVWIIYGNQNSILNSPNVENYGTVLCLGDSSYFIVQIAFPRNNNTKITFRLRNDYYNSNWTDWSPL